MYVLRRLVLLILLLPALLLPVFALNVLRGPYLTLATPTSVTVHWRTDSLCNGAVRYGLSPNALVNTHASLNYVSDHVITLQNLQPNTKYFYAIGTSTSTLAGDSTFCFFTMPTASPQYESPVRFWAVGDMSKQTQQQLAVRDSYLKYKGSRTVHGWILLGDNAYNSGYDAEYQAGFFNYYQDSVLKNTVLWPVLGNHDYGNNYTLRTTWQIPYLDIFSLPHNAEAGGVPSGNERYYSMNYGNVHFVHLDSYGLEPVNGNWYGLADTQFSPQVNWLRNDLQANQLPWVVVSYHHPPYCIGTHNSDLEGDLVALRSNLNPILERYNVDLVLNGHCHTYQRTQFIKGHYGLEPSFDTSLHVRQLSNGSYDGTPGSCAYVKNSGSHLAKDSGVIYLVIGSGGAVPQQPYATWPHNAMTYSNYADNGSLLLTVEGNRLDAEWISTDTLQPVKDRFTLFKNVGQTKVIHTSYPAQLNLKASWQANVGSYQWSHGDSLRLTSVPVSHDTLFTVTDLWNCFTDTFLIRSIPLGMPETPASHGLLLYPNPNSGSLFVELPSATFLSFRILSLQGALLQQGPIEEGKGQFQLQLEGGLAAGEYVLELQGEDGRRIRTPFQRLAP